MKLAYIAYNKNALKCISALAQQFSQIDVYLAEPNEIDLDMNFEELPVMTNQLYVPQNADEHTSAHKALLKDIKSEYSFFAKNIYANQNLKKQILPSAETSSEYLKNIYALSDVTRLFYDKKTRKHEILTIKNPTPIKYDFLVFQDHAFLLDVLLKKEQNLIESSGQRSHVMICMSFEVKNRQSLQHKTNEFIFINNTSVKSIYDNWFICSLNEDQINVSLIIPNEQKENSKYIQFVVQRTKEVMVQALCSFTIGDFVSYKIQACDGFLTNAFKLKIKKNMSAFPSFLFWSQEKTIDYVQQVFIDKNRKRFAVIEKETQL